MKKNRDLLHSVKPGKSDDRDRLVELLSDMTDEQRKRLLKMAEKMAG